MGAFFNHIDHEWAPHLLLALRLGVPGLRAAGITRNVEDEHRVRPVVGQPLRVVDAVALDRDVAHQVAPLVLQED